MEGWGSDVLERANTEEPRLEKLVKYLERTTHNGQYVLTRSNPESRPI